VRGRIGGLHLIGQCLRLGHQFVHLRLEFGLGGVVGVLELSLHGTDLLAECLLLGAQLIESLTLIAGLLVGGDEPIDHGGILAATALGLADPLGISAQHDGVDHRLNLSARVPSNQR